MLRDYPKSRLTTFQCNVDKCQHEKMDRAIKSLMIFGLKSNH